MIKFKLAFIFLSIISNINVSLSSEEINFKNEKINLKIIPTINEKSITLSEIIKLDKKTSIKINKLKFYISNLNISNDSTFLEQIDKFDNQNVFLFDLNNNNSNTLNVNYYKNYKLNNNKIYIKFDLGIDSTTNHCGPKNGGLDPINNMYWAWQSGYINFKFEGEVLFKFKNQKSHKYNSKELKTKEFTYHLGGFLSPFNSSNSVMLIYEKSTNSNTNNFENEILLNLELSKILNILFINNNKEIKSQELNNCYNIMSPSKKSVLMSKLLSNSFVIK